MKKVEDMTREELISEVSRYGFEVWRHDSDEYLREVVTAGRNGQRYGHLAKAQAA